MWGVKQKSQNTLDLFTFYGFCMNTKIVSELLSNEDGIIQDECIVRLKFVQSMSGDELIDIIGKGVEGDINNLKNQLSCYDKETLFKVWFHYVRLVEEFINIRYELDKRFTQFFNHIHIGNECEMKIISSMVEELFGKQVSSHLHDITDLFKGFSSREVVDDKVVEVPIVTLGDLWNYLQKSRLHIMTILNLIPIRAQGNRPFCMDEIKVKMNDWVEKLMMKITAGCQAMLEAKCMPNFYGELTKYGIRFSHHYTHLEDMFLEPQRLTPVDIELYRSEGLEERKRKTRNSICSLEEFDIVLYNDTIYYKKYGLLNSDKYKSLVAFMYEMKAYFKDDYEIEVPQKVFEQLCQKYNNIELYREIVDFYDIQNSRYGFVKNEDSYYSTYFMLIRFYFNYIEKILRRNKTFQIDSGFVFEAKVAEMVANYGFEVQKDCKRINHKEFDVVCIKNDTIYNFQCKNNYTSVASIGVCENELAARYNRRLMRYYEKAMQKEKNREHLLVNKLKTGKIQHYVISRFPIITDSVYVIPFNRLEAWLAVH